MSFPKKVFTKNNKKNKRKISKNVSKIRMCKRIWLKSKEVTSNTDKLSTI